MRHALLALVLFSSPVLAATIVVDEVECKLVHAIEASVFDQAVDGCPAGNGPDTIELATDVTLTTVNYVYNGPNGLPTINGDLTIEGRGFTIRREVGAPVFRLFIVNIQSSLTINETTLQNGDVLPTGVPLGGAILTLGTLNVLNSTITGSRAPLNAAIGTLGGIVNVANSTVSGNIGGGISISSSGTGSVRNTTVTQNSGWGIDSLEGLDVGYTILADNANGNCGGPITDFGHNFADDATCGAGFEPITPDVDFETLLDDNGGPTRTHALLPGSRAADAGGFCTVAADQRGVPRDDFFCDSGAYEIARVAFVPPPVPDGTQGPSARWSRADPTGSTVDVSWCVEYCPAAGYHLIYGSLADVEAYETLGSVCTLGDTGSASGVPLPDGDLWMLVVAEDSWQTEGSWGQAWDGERNGTNASGACGFVARTNAGSCP